MNEERFEDVVKFLTDLINTTTKADELEELLKKRIEAAFKNENYQKVFISKRSKKDNERVMIAANHGVNIKLNLILNGKRSLTVA
ncbi:unnamed protein product [Rotaria sp. Silwood2]|nr:unnamed protein product [Rotaria sp. Silwood2]